jgi:FlaA1/EpsC-like NDP-sugar epimerase
MLEQSTLDYYSGKVVLITGVAGTIGREIITQLKNVQTAYIIGIDNNEMGIFLNGYEDLFKDRVQLYLGDLRDRDTLYDRFRGVDIVFHSAALKHVELSERSPRDAIQTNILGTQNVIEAATARGVKEVIFTSSDKAVNPTNVMGTSKLMCERLMTAANSHWQNNQPKFFSTRFGNVLGSRGSVIPLFIDQIAAGGPLTITHEDMTRFIMTQEESVQLLMESACLAKGGEVFVTKMPVARVTDLAWVMIEELAPRFGYRSQDIAIEYIGRRPGEKLYEELLSEEESQRAIETDRYIIIIPPTANGNPDVTTVSYGSQTMRVEKPYSSRSVGPMSCDKLRQFLLENSLLQSNPTMQANPCV